MIIGETLKESNTDRFSPWFPRQGDGAVFAVRAIVVSGAVLLFDVAVETKNSEEADGAAATVGYLPQIAGSSGVAKGYLSGLKELVRYRYEVSSDPPAGSEWVHFEVLDPMWARN